MQHLVTTSATYGNQSAGRFARPEVLQRFLRWALQRFGFYHFPGAGRDNAARFFSWNFRFFIETLETRMYQDVPGCTRLPAGSLEHFLPADWVFQVILQPTAATLQGAPSAMGSQLPATAQDQLSRILVEGYPLVNMQKAIENGHRNSEFSHFFCWNGSSLW